MNRTMRRQAALMIAALCLTSISACSTGTLRCTYTNSAANPIPTPAFWAVTDYDGAQLITPNSELWHMIAAKYQSVGGKNVMHTGDILIADKAYSTIAPESIGVRRELIQQCDPEEE